MALFQAVCSKSEAANAHFADLVAVRLFERNGRSQPKAVIIAINCSGDNCEMPRSRLVMSQPRSSYGHNFLNIREQILRSWVSTGDQEKIVVTDKTQVLSRLFHGHCPIEAAMPYSKADLPPARFQHSMTEEDLRFFFKQAERAPRSMLEIGSFWGDTAILAAQTFGVPVVCVDTWLGGLAVWGDAPPNGFLYQDFAKNKKVLGRYLRTRTPVEIPPATTFFRQFASNVVEQNQQSLITPLRLPSPSALRLIGAHGMQFDAVYVDGSHDFIDVYIDITLAQSVSTKEGVIFGDDFQLPDVRDAVTSYCQDAGLEFSTYSLGKEKRRYWMIQPGKS
ncbi:MAG: hypothetical protein ACJA06_001485 [Halocynthiibacter sp.]|jgi:hypothetical protein